MHCKIKPNTPRMASATRAVSTQKFKNYKRAYKNYLNLEILSQKTNPYASLWKKIHTSCTVN